MADIPHAVQAEREASHEARNQVSMLAIAEGFFQSEILFALLKLHIFKLIGDSEKSAAELAAALKTETRTLARLLNAGVVIQLLRATPDGKYGLTDLARSTLVASTEQGYMGNWIRNLAYFQEALSRLDEAVLNSAPTVDSTAHLGDDPETTRDFIFAMHDYAVLRGQELARYLVTTGCKSLLDLGCGPGTYSFSLGRANPDLKLSLLDLKGVLEVTREIQAAYGCRNEVCYLPMDAMQDNIPGEYDMVLVSNTLHMLGHQASSTLLKRLYDSVRPGGSLVIQGQFLRDDWMGSRWPVLLDLIQLCITREGANHSVSQTRGWLNDAGFRNVEFCPMGLLNSNSFLRGYRV